MNVHPVAALFPMLPDDELDDLAADIAENGLIHPIVLDAEDQLIDGRNRLAACERAGVEPKFERLNGHDPVAYILSSNIARRHMTKGQRAMAVAQVLVTNTLTQGRAAQAAGLKRERVVIASAVIKWAPDLAEPVLIGAVSLDEAYAEAQKRKKAADSTEAQLDRLRETAPDLADQVVEERLSLIEAVAAAEARIREREEARRDAWTLVGRIIDLAGSNEPEFLDAWAERLGELDPIQIEEMTTARDVLSGLLERVTR